MEYFAFCFWIHEQQQLWLFESLISDQYYMIQKCAANCDTILNKMPPGNTKKERRKCFIYGVRHMVKDHSDSEQGFFYIHHPTDRLAHTRAFVAPIVEHWLEWEIAQWVHQEWSIRQIHRNHDRTLLPRSYISLYLCDGAYKRILAANRKAWPIKWQQQVFSHYLNTLTMGATSRSW